MLAAVLTLLIIMGIGVYSGMRIKDVKEFDSGGKSAGAILVAGSIIGTLVGGSSTIGTAELAFKSGLSAWWFTLGASLGCLLLALPLCRPLRDTKGETIQEMIGLEFGDTSRVATSILASLGIMLNIVAQMLAANALLTTMFGLDSWMCAVISIVIMTCYVMFGGMRGTGILGVVKLVLIYCAALVCGFTALHLTGGLGEIAARLPAEQYFNLFARGPFIDLGAGVSVALGVVSTQTYIQAIRSAKSDKAARQGALIGAVMIPPIGILSILVGYFMKLEFPDMSAGQAFPRFLIERLPPVLGGVFLATLLIAIVGTGSGMALGFGKIVTNDIYKRYIRPNADGREQLIVTRAVILLSLVVAAVFTTGNLGSAILTWGFMSMGLRAVVLLVPMLMALYLPGRMRSGFAIAASVLGLAAMLIGNFLSLPFDSLFLGLAVSVAVIVIGLCVGCKPKNESV